MISSGVFTDLSIGALASRRDSDGVTLSEIADAIESAVEKSRPFGIWRDFNLSALRERLDHPFIPRPYAGQQQPELWDLPFAAKDVFNSTKFGVEKGSRRWVGYRAGNNARVVDHAERSGCVLVGMTATSEFAVDKESSALNPHDPLRTPGTSSGGSAVACALGLVPFALGSQSGASIIRPASFTGTIGMKPSFGLIPRTGALKTSDSLDTVGFFAARVDLLRSVLTALRVSGRDYPFVNAFVDTAIDAVVAPGSLRIGIARTRCWDGCDPDVARVLEQLVPALDDVSGGVQDVDLVDSLGSAHDLHDVIYNASLAYHLSEDFDMSPGDFSPVLHSRMAAGREVSREEYAAALDAQNSLADLVDTKIRDYDIVMSIATSTVAPLRDEIPRRDPSLIWTMAGVPAVCVPAGVAPNGMPVGVQFIASKYRDYQLIAALEYLARTGVISDRSLPVPGGVLEPQRN